MSARKQNAKGRKQKAPKGTGLKLLVTPELERLARWLRLLGCDVEVYRKNPRAIFPIAFGDRRTILTCNRRITPSSLVTVIHLEPVALEHQFAALRGALKLPASPRTLFARCSLCNALLTEIAKARVKGRVPDYVFQTQTRFTTCPRCRRIYWTATHHDRAREFLKQAGIL